MGADAWMYTVPLQSDIMAALSALRQREFRDAVVSPGCPADWPRPSTIDEFRVPDGRNAVLGRRPPRAGRAADRTRRPAGWNPNGAVKDAALCSMTGGKSLYRSHSGESPETDSPAEPGRLSEALVRPVRTRAAGAGA
ncbi:hypothetical protein GCM10009735_69690 [Actinomadura chokoriensis]